MVALRVLFATFLGTSAMAASIAARSRDLCDGNEVRLRSIEVWSLSGYLGYLSPAVAYALGGGYGILTTDRTEALSGVIACGDPSQPHSAVTITATNAQTVDGTDIDAIGLVAPYYPNSGSPNVAIGSANWLFMGPTYVSGSDPRPNGTGITVDGTQAWFESNVWSTGYLSLSGQIHNGLFPAWTNEIGGDSPVLELALLVDQGGIVLTGDYDAFTSSYSYAGTWEQVWLVLDSH